MNEWTTRNLPQMPSLSTLSTSPSASPKCGAFSTLEPATGCGLRDFRNAFPVPWSVVYNPSPLAYGHLQSTIGKNAEGKEGARPMMEQIPLSLSVRSAGAQDYGTHSPASSGGRKVRSSVECLRSGWSSMRVSKTPFFLF
jgi:hypothetical protein